MQRGMQCAALDKVYDGQPDCLTPDGLHRWVDELCFLDKSGLAWFGTQCSSFVLLCKKQSARNPSNAWIGDESCQFVKDGNKLMHITAMLYLVAHMNGCNCVLEQPGSSVLPRLQPLSTVLTWTQAAKTSTWHGSFGGDSPKPLQLWHTHPEYRLLSRKRPLGMQGLTTRKPKEDGSIAYTGKLKALKASQCYGVEFSRAVAGITQTLAVHG